MCLCPEHFLFSAVLVIPGSGAAAGQGVGNCSGLPAGCETVCHMQGVIPPRLQLRQILPRVYRRHEADKSRRAQAETKSQMSRFRGRNNQVSDGAALFRAAPISLASSCQMGYQK